MKMNEYMTFRGSIYSLTIFIVAWMIAWCICDYEIKSFADVVSKSLITLFIMIITYPLTVLFLGTLLKIADKKIRQKLRLSL